MKYASQGYEDNKKLITSPDKEAVTVDSIGDYTQSPDKLMKDLHQLQ